jgi:S-adenosylmethionine uptake transporter
MRAPALLYCVGIAFFCAMDAVMKMLIGRAPVLSATVWRYAAAILFCLAIWWQAGRPAITRDMLRPHALRGVVIAATAFLFFWSLTRLPLVDAVALSFVGPLLVAPLAAVGLSERLEPRAVLAALAGFAGVLVAATGAPTVAAGAPTSPGPLALWLGVTERTLGVFAVVAAAVLYAVSIVMMRNRAARDGPAIVSLLGAAFPLLWLSPVVAATGVPVLPRLSDAWLVLLAGALGAAALQFYARALALAQAQRMAPFEYTAFFWAALWGWAAFDEGVSPATFAGAVVIAAACLWNGRVPAAPVAPG